MHFLVVDRANIAHHFIILFKNNKQLYYTAPIGANSLTSHERLFIVSLQSVILTLVDDPDVSSDLEFID